jgi:hypothetical protein
VAAPDNSYLCGEHWTFNLGGVASATMDLPEPGATSGWVIDMIHLYAEGTVTVHRVDVTTEAGAASIAKIGGQEAVIPNEIQGPIACGRGIAAQVILTATGATGCQVGVTAHLEPA